MFISNCFEKIKKIIIKFITIIKLTFIYFYNDRNGTRNGINGTSFTDPVTATGLEPTTTSQQTLNVDSMLIYVEITSRRWLT